MFIEAFNRIDRLGCIALATSEDAISWNYERVVLKESFHLAYPHIFAWQNEIFMVPDTPGQGVNIYRATEFPYRWEHSRQLINDTRLSDSTIFSYDNRWWMFTCGVSSSGSPGELRLYHAEELLGEWKRHPSKSFELFDQNAVRPAGPVIKVDDSLYRFAQVSGDHYGEEVVAYRILTLTEDAYDEARICTDSLLTAGIQQWNSKGMHHICAQQISAGRWISAVDGWC